MTVSVSADTDLRVLNMRIPARRSKNFGRWVEAAMLAAAILMAPVAFILGLAIYAWRIHRR